MQRESLFRVPNFGLCWVPAEGGLGISVKQRKMGGGGGKGMQRGYGAANRRGAQRNHIHKKDRERDRESDRRIDK